MTSWRRGQITRESRLSSKPEQDHTLDRFSALLARPVLATQRRISAKCARPSIAMAPKQSSDLATPDRTMHRALLIPELVRLIFSFLAPYSDDDEHDPDVLYIYTMTSGQFGQDSYPAVFYRQDNATLNRLTLAALARTCRGFHDHALDLLWARLDGLDPLIRLLPHHVWAQKRSQIVVKLSIRRLHWVRFQKYASRVQKLYGPWVKLKIPNAVVTNVITALARYSPETIPLLPNLRELTWRETDRRFLWNPCVSLLKHFVSPCITRISLRLPYCQLHAFPDAAAISELSVLCPSVTSFTLSLSDMLYADSSQQVGNIVRRWTHLHELHTCPLPPPVMQQLAAQRTLTTLEIDFNHAPFHVFPGALPDTLKTLSLRVITAAQCTQYIGTLSGAPASLTITITSDPPQSELAALLRTVCDRFAHDALQSLVVDFTRGWRNSWGQESQFISPSLDETMLRPLFAFRRLRRLSLDDFATDQLDDAFYLAAAQAWPGLEVFLLGTNIWSPKPVLCAGMEALAALLVHCPRLRAVGIVLDAHVSVLNIDPAGRWAARAHRAPHEGVTSLFMGHSFIRDALEVTGCFNAWMPSLKHVDSSWVELTDYSKRWKRVQMMLRSSDYHRRWRY